MATRGWEEGGAHNTSQALMGQTSSSAQFRSIISFKHLNNLTIIVFQVKKKKKGGFP